MPATRLYLRALTPSAGPGETELSTALPSGTGKDFNVAVQALELVPGSAETTCGGSGLAQTGAQSNFFTSFSSDALAGQTIAAQTWTFAACLNEGNTDANSFIVLSLYVYRAGSGVVGYIYDSATHLGTEWSAVAATLNGRVVTFSGAQVVAALNDFLVLEVWRHATSQSMATAYTQTLYYDGATDVVANANSGDAASYLEDTNGLAFLSPPSLTMAPMTAPDRRRA